MDTSTVEQAQTPTSPDAFTFDNGDRLASLARQIQQAEQALKASQAESERTQRQALESQQVLLSLEQIEQVDFAVIDLPAAEAALESLHERLAAHTAPDSDAEQARRRWAEADAQLSRLRIQSRDLELEEKGLDTRWETSLEAQQRPFRRIGAGLTDEQWSLATAHLTEPSADQLKELEDLERAAAAHWQTQIDDTKGKLATVNQNLIRAMEKARGIDRGALSEVRSHLEDIHAFLERLRVLTEEALPEKLNRFLTYLNQSSDEGVTQLLSHIDNEVSAIEERIEDLNRTLRRVSFQPGAYLKLQPERVVHESLRTLQQAQRHLRSASLKDDQGESHFKALRHVVDLVRHASESRKTQGARALLDPRYRLTFAVSVVSAETGAILENPNQLTGRQWRREGDHCQLCPHGLTQLRTVPGRRPAPTVRHHRPR